MDYHDVIEEHIKKYVTNEQHDKAPETIIFRKNYLKGLEN